MFHSISKRTALATAATLIVTLLSACGSTTEDSASPSEGGSSQPVSDVRLVTAQPVVTDDGSDFSKQLTSRAVQFDYVRTSTGTLVSPTSSMYAFLTAALLDVHGMWSRWFQAWGYTAPRVSYLWTSSGDTSALGCRSRNNDLTAEYCSSTDQITISRQMAFDLWEGRLAGETFSGSGDMAVALIVAHEYGHNIVYELGLRVTAAQNERLADCFAGNWARYAANRGRLDRGDYEEAYAALDILAEKPWRSDGGIHGTVEDRQNAFYLGATTGPANCVAAYT